MPTDNEELMNDLQRVSAVLRRSHHDQMKGGHRHRHHGAEAAGEDHAHHGKKCHGAEGKGAGHGYGSHKCHGGSGRHGQNRILAVLVMQDGTSQKDLAYLLGIRPQSLTQALESLEAHGYITRKQDESDHRTRRVFLTEKGAGRAAKVAEDRKSYADNALGMLSEEVKAPLSDILAKINAGLDEKLAEGE